MKWEIMESGKKMKKLQTIGFESMDDLLEFLHFVLDDEPEVCLTKLKLHEACDYAWEAWSKEKSRTREEKMAVAAFVRALTMTLFEDDKTEKEEN